MDIRYRLIISICLGLSFVGFSLAAIVNKDTGLVLKPEPLGLGYPGPESSFYSQAINFLTGDKPKDVATTSVVEIRKNSESVSSRPKYTRAYIVGNLLTGKVYLEKNSGIRLPVASMSKLVTAMAAKNSLDPDKVVEVSESVASLPPDSSRLLAGEKFSIDELLYPMLLNSSNVAAETIASGADSRVTFLELMSSYSWEVGMPDTFFADASGLSSKNEATARDLFALAKYLYDYRSDILEITRLEKTSVATTSDHGYHEFTNIHPFVKDSGFIGGKTGRTDEAGETMMTLINIKNQPIAIVILGSNFGQREADTRELIQRVTPDI